MVPRIPLIVLVLATLVLAGCNGPGEDPVADRTEDPIVHTRPGDFNATTDSSKFHLHDYWFGQDHLLLMEDQRRTSVTTMGSSVNREQFRPEAGSVVPLGAANVSVTLSWELEEPFQHGDVWLYVKTQVDNESQPFRVVENGVPVVFPTTNPQNDLPHQLLSAWSFDLFLTPDPQSNILRFNGYVSIEVVVERGHPIPLFRPHPDHWGNVTEILLFQEEAEVGHIDHAPAPNSICTGGCLPVHTPVDGAIVPLGTSEVVVRVTPAEGNSGDVWLGYHGGDSREMTTTDPSETDGTTWVYRLPVAAGMVDGPYASSSLWEFQLITKRTEDNGAYFGSYTIEAKAVRGP